MLPNEYGYILLATLCDRLFERFERAIILIAKTVGQRVTDRRARGRFQVSQPRMQFFREVLWFSFSTSEKEFFNERTEPEETRGKAAGMLSADNALDCGAVKRLLIVSVCLLIDPTPS